MCDAANNASRLTRDYDDVRKKFTDISSIININFNLANFAAAKLATSLLVFKQQLSISVRCASEMVIILRIKPHEILEKTPLGHLFYECLHEISWT